MMASRKSVKKDMSHLFQRTDLGLKRLVQISPMQKRFLLFQQYFRQQIPSNRLPMGQMTYISGGLSPIKLHIAKSKIIFFVEVRKFKMQQMEQHDQ